MGSALLGSKFYARAPVRVLFLGALDLLYLGVTIENICRRHYRAPGHHYQYMDIKSLRFSQNICLLFLELTFLRTDFS